MTEIGATPLLPAPQGDRDVAMMSSLQDFFSKVVSILDRGIAFSDNVDCRLVTFTSSGTANNENTISHTLGKVPTGYIVYSQDKSASLYLGTTSWTTSSIYLKCSVATVAYKIIIF